MFKTKENVINRKFKVFTLDLEFISLLRQDFFYIFFLIKPLLIHVSSYYMFTQPLILNSPLKVKKVAIYRYAEIHQQLFSMVGKGEFEQLLVGASFVPLLMSRDDSHGFW